MYSIETFRSETTRKTSLATTLDEGQVIYAITRAGRYFIWSYTDLNFAGYVVRRLEQSEEECVHCSPNYVTSFEETLTSIRQDQSNEV